MLTFQDIFKSDFLSSVDSISLVDIALALVLSFALGLFIFFVYKKTYMGVMYSSSFGVTLVALTMITTVVILAVTSNVVLSLGMVGALSIVRFRAAIKEPLEIAFLFRAIAVGIVLAAGLIVLAVIGSAVIGLILIVFVNRRSWLDPYIVVLRCDGAESEREAADDGEDWGLYLAVEGVEESFLLRNYGTDYGELYKPDSMEMGGGRGNGGGFGGRGGMGGMPSDMGEPPEDMGGMPDMSEMPEMGEIPDMGEVPEMGEMPEMGGGMGGGMMGGSSDVLLVYTDDDYDSYANIFDNAKTDVSNADKDRLIDALQALGEGGDVSDCVDIESVISYFVAHNFVCNFDSYTGSMIHNYYLYEGGGVLSCLQCLCQCLVRGGEDGLIVGVYDLSGQGAGGLLDVAGARPVHGSLARVARLGEICRQRGRLLHRARVRQAVLGPYDDVGAVGLLHVQPDVRAARGFERQLVVLRVRTADQYLVAPARNKAHGAQRLGAALLAAALRRAKDPRGDELPAQLRYLLLARSAGQQVQHAFEVVQHGLALGYELGQVLLGGDGLFVLLVGRSGVLLRRFHRVERYLYLGAALGVVVLTDERPRALFRAPEVRRDEVAAAAQLFPVRRARKLRALLAQLAGLPVPQGADCLDRVVRDAAHALGALPARVEFLKQV